MSDLSLENYFQRFNKCHFLAGHAGLSGGSRVRRNITIVLLSWLLTCLLLLVTNIAITNPFVSSERIEAVNKGIAGAHREGLPKVSFTVQEKSRWALGDRTDSVFVHLEHGRSFSKRLVFRESQLMSPFWVLRNVGSEISLEAVAKCVDRLAEESPGESVKKASAKDRTAFVSQLRQILLDNPETNLRALEAPYGALAMQRRINGVIQFFTFWSFAALFVLLLARRGQFVRFQNGIFRVATYEDEAGNQQRAPWVVLTEYADKLNERLRDSGAEGYTDEFKADAKALAMQYETVGESLRHRGYTSAHVDLMKQALVGSLSDSSPAANIPGFVSAQSQTLSVLAYESGTTHRYLIWLIPTIGFVGTVLGIGQTLQGTSLLDSVDELVRIAGKSEVNTSIAVAFDTTFVSLILSIIAMRYQLSAASEEESLIHSQADAVIRTVANVANAESGPTPIPQEFLNTGNQRTGDDVREANHVRGEERRGSFGWLFFIVLILGTIGAAVWVAQKKGLLRF